MIISSQDSRSYSLFQTGSGKFLGSFNIVSGAIEEVSRTDGLDWAATSTQNYSDGLFVVQDDENTMPDTNQNFKLVSRREVIETFARSE